MDIDFGPDGSLYVIEWGSGFNGNNADSGVYRIDYIAGDKAPDRARRRRRRTTGLAPLTVQFSSAGSSDPEGTVAHVRVGLRRQRHDRLDATPTRRTPTRPAGTYNAKLTVTDQARPDRRRQRPDHGRQHARRRSRSTFPEDGQFASFGDTVAVQDHGHRPRGRHDRRRHRLRRRHASPSRSAMTSTRTACRSRPAARARSRRGLTAGHGAEGEHLHRRSASTYTDKGATAAAPPLTGRAEAILQPKPQAGGVLRLHRPRRRTRTDGRRPGRARRRRPPTRRRRQEHRLHRGRRLRLLQAGQPQGHHARCDFRVASARRGRHDRGAPRLADRPARRHDGDRHADRRLAELDGRLAAADQPADRHARAVPRVPQPRPTQAACSTSTGSRFIGKGAAITAPPEVTATATPRPAPRRSPSHFNATATDPDGPAPLTYAWDFGVPGTSDDTSTQEDPTYTYATRGHLHGDADRDRRRTAGTPRPRVQVAVTAPGNCPANNLRSDEFDGSSLDTSRWTGAAGPTTPGRRPSRTGRCTSRSTTARSTRPARSARNIIAQPTCRAATVDGDGQDHDRAAHRQLPAGRSADLRRRRQLGVGAHDLRGHRP